MPAPLAKGLIISLSILFAAGLAVYDNPQIRQWVDESRRKIAIALHSLGDEIQPPQRPRTQSRSSSTAATNGSPSRPAPHSRNVSDDASTREDDSAEAVERRRRAREEILERGRLMELRRMQRSGEASQVKVTNPDTEGQVVQTTESDTHATSAEGLRHRNIESHAAALADPFADEKGTFYNETLDPTPQSRESTATILPEPAQPELTLLIPASADGAVTEPPSPTNLIDLTPTTSAFPSHFSYSSSSSPSPVLSPTRAPAPAPDPVPASPPQQYHSLADFADWASNASAASFYSPPGSEQGELERGELVDLEARMREMVEGSESGWGSEGGEGEGVATPMGSWSEVGSVVSEGDYGR